MKPAALLLLASDAVQPAGDFAVVRHVVDVLIHSAEMLTSDVG